MRFASCPTQTWPTFISVISFAEIRRGVEMLPVGRRRERLATGQTGKYLSARSPSSKAETNFRLVSTRVQ